MGAFSRPGRRRLPLTLIILLSACGHGPAGDGSIQNAVLITLDTTRFDVLSGDEASRKVAPAIARLAKGGLRFPRAYTVAPLTLPAHASILTGLYPPRHGVRDNGIAALPESATTLAEICRAAGFDTAAFVSSAVLDRGYNLDQGFERYDQPALKPRPSDDFYLERPAHETAAAVVGWLRERDSRGARPGRRILLWIHLFDPHIPYAPAREFLEQAGGDPYRGEIAAVDRAVGEILAALEETGLDRTTLIVLTADHGESRGEHGEPTHGALCYEETVRVPLILRFPGPPPRPGPARLASAVDLAPTILGRLGLALPADLDGIDLFSSATSADRGVYFESCSGYLNYGWSALAGWLDSRGKYLHSSKPEFYLPLEDPDEERDLARQRVRECEQARAKLRAVLDRPALASEPVTAQGELMRALSALGYAHAGDSTTPLGSPLEPSDRPSPRERRAELQPLLVAHEYFRQGRFAECLSLVEEIVRQNPGQLLALDLLSVSLMQLGRFEQAEGFLRQRLARGPERADTRLNLGLSLRELGRESEALEELRAAERLDPGQPAIREALDKGGGRAD